MKKTIINRQILIDASTKEVWDKLADFGNVQNMSPNIAKSFLTNDQEIGLGTTRHCNFYTMGAEVDERISDWVEGKSLTIDLFNPKNLPMIKGMQAYFEVSESEGKTLLTGNFEYGMSNALGQLLNQVKMRSMNIKSWEEFMAGIKYHVETGKVVDKKTKLDRALVLA